MNNTTEVKPILHYTDSRVFNTKRQMDKTLDTLMRDGATVNEPILKSNLIRQTLEHETASAIHRMVFRTIKDGYTGNFLKVLEDKAKELKSNYKNETALIEIDTFINFITNTYVNMVTEQGATMQEDTGRKYIIAGRQ